mmetsp:Transcript_56779/g.176063  ORF Transcript_56779/g.176063 Transcript_56779/m.176063 type:complete len:230 (-) Transcript_56779:473-1162(-)
MPLPPLPALPTIVHASLCFSRGLRKCGQSSVSCGPSHLSHFGTALLEAVDFLPVEGTDLPLFVACAPRRSAARPRCCGVRALSEPGASADSSMVESRWGRGTTTVFSTSGSSDLAAAGFWGRGTTTVFSTSTSASSRGCAVRRSAAAMRPGSFSADGSGASGGESCSGSGFLGLGTTTVLSSSSFGRRTVTVRSRSSLAASLAAPVAFGDDRPCTDGRSGSFGASADSA